MKVSIDSLGVEFEKGKLLVFKQKNIKGIGYAL